MAHRLIVFVTGALLASGLHAQEGSNLLSGFSIRLDGGLSRLSGMDGMTDHLDGMNAYFGADGSWVRDAQGDGFQFDWAPYLSMPGINNSASIGVTLEKAFALNDFSRVVVGVEYSTGGASSSNIFSFQAGVGGSGGEGSIWASEKIDVTSTMLTGRYSLRDLNLPVHVHAGLGLGMASIDNKTVYNQMGPVVLQTDPLFGESAVQHNFEASYDGSTFAGRIFTGFEWNLGPTSFILDLGYEYMDFGSLDGSANQVFRDFYGNMVEYEITGVPDGRYELAPVLSASLRHVRDQRLEEARFGIDLPVTPVDVDGAADEIEFDMSGGFVKFSVGYNF